MTNDSDDFLVVDPETAWLERITIGGFRVWHLIAFCVAIVLTIIIMVCCCIRFRIPRTKQEIEADYQRKQITKKFREKLQQIKNSEMDNMDLQKVIAHIQADLQATRASCDNLDAEPMSHVKYASTIQVPA